MSFNLKKIQFTKVKYFTFWLSFLLPALTFLIYFACHQFNFLTVDLGQQYIDLLAFLRNNLFSHPGRLIYSFQNGLGGSMLATDAYYLTSPFNLILFLFPKSQLPIAILTIITCKFGAAGLSSFYYWQQKYDQRLALAAAIAYSLSCYVVAYYFNLMWLDSVILLPLLINAIDRLFKNKNNHLVGITFLIWFTNFYSGVMALFFGFLYFISKLLLTKKEFRLSILAKYLWKSFIASLIASFILIPVFFELIGGRAHSATNWTISWQFIPYYELAKLTNGAYSYHEMEAGMPNIFMTTPFLLLTLNYFLTSTIKKRTKLVNGILLIFLLLSLSFTPFVLLWHLGQFPVWYPGRFSFVLIFFCLNLALVSLNKTKITFQNRLIIGIAALLLVGSWYFIENKIAFLNENKLLISVAFLILALLYLFFIFQQFKFDKEFLLSIVFLEAVINLIFTLNSISFQNNQDYQNFAANTNQAATYLNQQDPQLFRTEKTFSRSDDDPMSANYNGISNFNSITNPQVLKLMAKLGYFHNSNSYTNNGGSLITDSMLGIKYYLLPNYQQKKIKDLMNFDNDNYRVDLENYHLQKNFSQLTLVKNHTALPLIFLTKKSIHPHFIDDEPMYNQQLLLNSILNKKSDFYQLKKLPRPIRYGCKQKAANLYIGKKKAKQKYLLYQIKLKSNDSYYLQIPFYLTNTQTTLSLNGKTIDLERRDDQAYLVNLASHQKGMKLNISFSLNQNQIDVNGLRLYQLKTKLLQTELQKLQKKQPKVWQKNSLHLTTSQFSTHGQTLSSTIPYDHNWLIFDNGKRITSSISAHTFLQAKLKQGKHQLNLYYIPWTFILGCFISLLALLINKAITLDLK